VTSDEPVKTQKQLEKEAKRKEKEAKEHYRLKYRFRPPFGKKLLIL